jgi:methyltransferase OMS1
MLAVSRAKAAVTSRPGRFSFALGAAEALPAEGSSFDTVVDTFGLCSFEDPAAALRQMAAALAPGGTLLLLEHGRSHYAFLNGILDRGAAAHATSWGCEWNRDIAAVVAAAAAAAGLEVVTLRRFHFGTTYYIKCIKQA